MAIDQNLMAHIPIDFVNQNNVFPFSLEDGVLKAATSNPFDVVARDKLARISGKRVETYIAPKDWIAKSIEIYYNTAQTIDDEINAITLGQSIGAASEEKQIIRLSNLLIDKGYVLGASDIHIVPDSNLVRIYYRIDGVLHQTYLFSKSFQHLGVNTSILASALSMVVAQRLVRLLCPHCSVKAPIDEHEIEIFEHNGMQPPAEVAKAKGCDNCFQSGYRGRVGVYEVIQVNRAIEELIFSGALHRAIEDAAIEAGTTVMFQQALKKVARHQTSLEEVMRVIVDYA